MCNGANLAYSRKAFYEVDGFKGIDKLPTGDDMLLMQKIFLKNQEGVQYIKSREAIVETHAPDTWKDFFQQRIRWASKAAYYEDKKIFSVLLLVYLFNVWLMVLMAGAFFSLEALNCLAVFSTGKILAELLFLWPVAGFFRKRKWLLWFAFLQPIHILYTVVAGWLGRFGSYQWKGRTISKPSTLTTS
jgi:cellulose synthase/poly-beta-1,6-N-acetylglucosamine synthase-like glycosyltransferase